MLKVLCFCIALSFYTLKVKSQSDEYAWEDYNGTIPSNAMPASDDPNNPVYIGKALIKENYCTAAILPSKTFECDRVQVKDALKILTVTDKEKFKWLPASSKNFSNIDEKDLVKTNYHNIAHSYWYVGRMKGSEGLRIKEVDGTLEVGDIIYNMFFSSKSNLYIDEAFDALVRSKEKATRNEIENPKTEQAQEPVEVVSEDLPSQPCQKVSQTEIDVLNQPTADANRQVAPEATADLNPGKPTTEANLNLKVEAAANAQVAKKKTSVPKAPAALNPDKPSVDANAGLKVEADGGAQAAPNAPAALKPPSPPKTSATPEAAPASKAPTTLNPGQSAIGANVDLKVEAAADAQVTPKEPSAPKGPTAMSAGQSIG